MNYHLNCLRAAFILPHKMLHKSRCVQFSLVHPPTKNWRFAHLTTIWIAARYTSATSKDGVRTFRDVFEHDHFDGVTTALVESAKVSC